MSRSSRLPDAPVIGVILAVVLALVVAALINQHNEAQRAERAAAQEYEESKWFLPFPTTAQRQRPDPQSYREEWRAERDLLAQRQMAKWAFWLLWVTAGGVALLALTLLETRKAALAALEMVDQARLSTEAAQRTADAATEANKQSKEAFLLTERPWISITDDWRFDSALEFRERISLKIIFTLKNTGKSPANRVWVKTKAYISGFGGDMADAARSQFWREVRESAGPGFLGQVIFPDDTASEEAFFSVQPEFVSAFRASDKQSSVIFLIANARYKFMGEDKAIHQTSTIFMLEQRGDDGNWTYHFSRGGGDVPADRLRLRRHNMGTIAD